MHAVTEQRASVWTLPDGSCDCHTHVFGSPESFPVMHKMHYELPLAPASLHRALLDQTGCSRGIIVQPGAYGDDPSVIRDALSQAGGRLRGIAVTGPTISESTLDAWHDAGIRGLRFNEMIVPGGTGRFAGSVGIDALESLAPRMRARHWHAEVWATIDQHVALLPRYRASGLPVVLDHMAGLVASRGANDPAFEAILAALAEGWLWVKLVLCRCSQDFPDYADLRPFHDALVAANPDRLVWGSDWPHLRLGDKTPDVGHLLDLFQQWVPDDAVRHRILVRNPQALYDF